MASYHGTNATFRVWSSSTTSTIETGSPSGFWSTSCATSGGASSTIGDTWYHWGSSVDTTGTADETCWTTWVDGVITDVQVTPGGYVYESNNVHESNNVAEPSNWKKDFLNRHYRNMQMKINMEWNAMKAQWLKEKKEAAESKAKELLLDLISQKEFDMYEKTGKLLVKGRKYDYIVHKKGGVTTLSKPSKFRHERQAEGLCVHLNSKDNNRCPATDNVIAMKLNIEHEESKFLKTANHHGKRSMNPQEQDFLKAVNE